MGAFWTAQVDVGGGEVLRRLLSRERVTLGRAHHAGLRVPESWVSAVQAELAALPPSGDLIVRNGTRTRMRVKSKKVWVTAQPGAAALIERGLYGPATLSWPELDGRLEVHLVFGQGDAPSLPLARDKPKPKASRTQMATGVAIERPRIDETLRHRMAVLFQHLIDDTEPPRNLYRHASLALGGMETEANLKTATHRLIDRINARRSPGHRIEGMEALGYYLVHTTGAVTEADLVRQSALEDTDT